MLGGENGLSCRSECVTMVMKTTQTWQRADMHRCSDNIHKLGRGGHADMQDWEQRSQSIGVTQKCQGQSNKHRGNASDSSIAILIRHSAEMWAISDAMALLSCECAHKIVVKIWNPRRRRYRIVNYEDHKNQNFDVRTFGQ